MCAIPSTEHVTIEKSKTYKFWLQAKLIVFNYSETVNEKTISSFAETIKVANTLTLAPLLLYIFSLTIIKNKIFLNLL